MPNIQVFSLADVLGRAEQIKAARLQNQRFMEEQEAERALSDILANSIDIQQAPESLQGATPLPTELSGPPQPTVPGVQPQWQPGRTEANLSWDKAFQNLAQADPRVRGQMAMKLQQMRMQEEQSRLKAMGEPSNTGMSPAHFKEIEIAPGKYGYGRYDPQTDTFIPVSGPSGRPAVARPTFTPFERGYGEGSGKGGAKEYMDIQKAASAADSYNRKLDRIQSLLGDYEGGKFARLGKGLASAARNIGINIDSTLPNKEAAEAIAGQLVLAMRDTEGAFGGMPGAFTEREWQRLADIQPGIEMTAEGRRKVVETFKEISTLANRMAKAATEYRKRRGAFDADFYDEWAAIRDRETPKSSPSQSGWTVRVK